MKARLGLVAGLLAVGSLLLTACGGGTADEPPADQTPYRVMISGGSDAGAFTNQLKTGVAAAKAATEVVNAAGGVNGRKVELIESQDNADATKALSNLRAQIAKAKPDAYLTAAGSGVSVAVAGILQQNEIIFLDSGNAAETNKPSTNPYAFHLAAPFKTVIESYLPELQAKSYKKVGVLHGNSAYAKQFGATATETYKAKGYEVNAVEYDAKALDMIAQISALQAFKPDVVVFNGYGAPVGYVLKGFTKLGWNVPLLGDTSVTATPLVTQLPPDGMVGTPEVANLKLEIARSLDAATASAATKKAVEAMKAQGQIFGSLNNCFNYDAIMLLAAAGNNAKSSAPKELTAALLKPEVNANAGTAVYPAYPYLADNHQPQLSADSHIFVAPSVMKDGQVGHTGN
ncbi:branched-chain amino acid ABC transporter substrate-binding protein [Rhizocola hellebori]|uniref:Branched-chain amino acid ABC transporter substrate-binding protein n=1 Tax=Rhizocola hellebori TaxID=1392758 RepID=A0A8J3Q9L9_9ACTN|nr:ABC transporter substrate-binding protein [Rhizocola hellebori]GIH06693.1 branched-chain amino acid ABC transporter substrate-binding protein [Rhizocola hellebori]